MASHHEEFAERDDVKLPSERSFGITFAVVFALLSVWLYFRKGHAGYASLTLIAAAGFLAAAYVRPEVLRPINKIWLRFGLLLHKVINPIVMGLLFFLVFTPMAMVMRMLGKDFLRITRSPEQSTYWIERTPDTHAPSSMKDQY
jgi:hypothetical protein